MAARETIAAVLRAANEPFSLESVVLPELQADEVLVRIHGTGMCRTDLAARQSQLPWPVVLGHEGAGVVEAVGDAVRGIAIGAHVVLSFDSCGACRSCLSAQPAYCYEFTERNMSGRASGRAPATDDSGAEVSSHWFGQSSFAGHAIANVRNTVPIDRDIPLEIAGPLGCGVQTGAGAILNVLRPGQGDSVVVLGAGGVGLSAILAARLAGAARIVAVETDESRRALAVRCGATEVCAPQDRGQLHRVAADADYALDTTGHADSIRLAFELLHPGGHCGLVAWHSVRPMIGPADLGLRGITVTGIMEGSAVPQEFIPRLVDLWKRGLFPFDQILQAFPLDDINAAERAMLGGEVVKPVLLPSRS